MAGNKLPHPSQLTQASDDELRLTVSRLFEDSDELNAVLLPLVRSQPKTTYDALIDSIRQELKALAPTAASVTDPANADDVHMLDDILNAHPRLGEKKANLSSSSAAEQANLQSSTDQDQARELETLNTEYEARFNGLRYLVFVNGRARPAIFEDMRKRMARADPWAERMEAVDALCDIASDRMEKMGVADVAA